MIYARTSFYFWNKPENNSVCAHQYEFTSLHRDTKMWFEIKIIFIEYVDKTESRGQKKKKYSAKSQIGFVISK